MSDTPRTDQIMNQFGLVPSPVAMAYNSLCREMERQNGELRAALVKCFTHLGKEIDEKHINRSAGDGTQALSREVATLLDATKPEKKWDDKTPQERNDALYREFGG